MTAAKETMYTLPDPDGPVTAGPSGRVADPIRLSIGRRFVMVVTVELAEQIVDALIGALSELSARDKQPGAAPAVGKVSPQ